MTSEIDDITSDSTAMISSCPKWGTVLIIDSSHYWNLHLQVYDPYRASWVKVTPTPNNGHVELVRLFREEVSIYLFYHHMINSDIFEGCCIIRTLLKNLPPQLLTTELSNDTEVHSGEGGLDEWDQQRHVAANIGDDEHVDGHGRCCTALGTKEIKITLGVFTCFMVVSGGVLF